MHESECKEKIPRDDNMICQFDKCYDLSFIVHFGAHGCIFSVNLWPSNLKGGFSNQGSLSHFLQGFIHARWCRTSSILHALSGLSLASPVWMSPGLLILAARSVIESLSRR